MIKITKAKLAKIKRRELKKLDKTWSIAIRNKFNNSCAYCGGTEYLHAAHILPREIREFRHNLDNGICLCARHHKFSYQFSFHKNPFAFFIWFQEKYPEQYNNLIQEYRKIIKIF